MLEKIFRIIVGLFVVIWVARYLGPEQFGLFSYVQSFVFLFTVISTLGLDSIIVRELVKGEKTARVLLGTAFVLKFVGALLILPVLAFSVMLTDNDGFTNILIFIVASAVVFQSFNVIDFYYQAEVLSRYVAYSHSISLGLSSVIKVVLILNESPLIYFVVVILLESIILALGLIYFYHKVSGRSLFKFRFDKTTALVLLKESWPLALSGMVVAIYMKVDQIMLNEIIGAEAVGQYAAAVQLSEAWYFIPMALASSLFPAIINAKEKCENLYRMRLQRLYTLVVWLGVSIGIFVFFFGDWIVFQLYGAEFDQTASVLVILIWAGIFAALLIVSGKWYVAEGYVLLAFYRNITALICNVILNYYLIPVYGVVGAAISTLISFILSSYIFDIVNSKTRQQFVLKTKTLIFKLN